MTVAWVRTAWAVTLVTLASLVVAEAAASLAWRMAHDGPILAYAAHAMNRYGLAPYRDLFDFNLPGTYAFFRVWDVLPGPLDLKFRVLDVLVLAGTAAGLGVLLRPFGARASVLAAALYGAMVLRYGAAIGLQRETIGLLPIVWGCVAAFERRRLGLVRSWMLAGLGFGLAASVKPQLAIGLPVVLAASWIDDRRAREGRRVVAAAVGALVMAALPLAIGIAWVAARGALPAMLAVFRDYVPLYLSLDENHRVVAGAARWSQAASSVARLGGLWAWLIPIAAGLVLARGGERDGLAVAGARVGAAPGGRASGDPIQRDAAERGRLRVLGALAAAYAVEPALSGQYWVYHWLPLACFLVAMAVASCARAATRGTAPAAIALTALWLAIAFQVRPPRAFVDQIRGHAPPASNAGVVDDIVARLAPLLRPGDRMQPLDWTGGAVHAMLRLDARPATRYLYDFSFYHHPASPIIQALRADLLRQLDAASPRFVIRILDTARPTGPETTDRFPELEAVLAQRYRTLAACPEYVIYGRMDSPPTSRGDTRGRL